MKLAKLRRLGSFETRMHQVCFLLPDTQIANENFVEEAGFMRGIATTGYNKTLAHPSRECLIWFYDIICLSRWIKRHDTKSIQKPLLWALLATRLVRLGETEAQVSGLLNTGEVPNLFNAEELALRRCREAWDGKHGRCVRKWLAQAPMHE